MNATLVLMSAAICAGMLAGCDRTKESANKPNAEVPPQKSSEAPPFPPGAPPASIVDQVPPQAPPSAAERKDGAPIQGQVDPKQPEQRRDFESKKP